MIGVDYFKMLFDNAKEYLKKKSKNDSNTGRDSRETTEHKVCKNNKGRQTV